MTTQRSGGEAQDYGYLFRVNAANGYRYWGHNGGGPGIQATFMHIPALGYTIIVLSNYGSAAMPVNEQLGSNQGFPGNCGSTPDFRGCPPPSG